MIELEHNVSSPQPYDRINLIAGTKGIFRDYPPRIYFDGARREEFESLDPYKEKYEHRAVEEDRRAGARNSAATAAWIS